MEHRFVEASAAAFHEEQVRKERARQRELSLISWLKRGAVAMAVVALVAMLAGAYAWLQRDVALRARDLAEKQAAAMPSTAPSRHTLS
jgi:Mn2+/Fe2+ NRAMP family transporter